MTCRGQLLRVAAQLIRKLEERYHCVSRLSASVLSFASAVSPPRLLRTYARQYEKSENASYHLVANAP